MKKTVSLLLAFLFVFLMSACGAKEEETTTAKTTEAAPVTETTAPEITRTQAEIDEIIAGIKKACVLSTVLDKYGSYMYERSNFEVCSHNYFFRENDEIVYVEKREIAGDNLETRFRGNYNGFEFYRYDGDQKTKLDFNLNCMSPNYEGVPAEPVDGNQKIFDPDEYSCFMLIGENEDSYFFSIDEDVTDPYSGEYGIYRFDKETLLPVQMEPPGVYLHHKFYYDVKFEKVREVFGDWQGDLRKITIIKEHYEKGESVIEEATVEIPATWELNVSSSSPYGLYMDADYTVEYSYPGDGVDCTIYARSIF